MSSMTDDELLAIKDTNPDLYISLLETKVQSLSTEISNYKKILISTTKANQQNNNNSTSSKNKHAIALQQQQQQQRQQQQQQQQFMETSLSASDLALSQPKLTTAPTTMSAMSTGSNNTYDDSVITALKSDYAKQLRILKDKIVNLEQQTATQHRQTVTQYEQQLKQVMQQAEYECDLLLTTNSQLNNLISTLKSFLNKLAYTSSRLFSVMKQVEQVNNSIISLEQELIQLSYQYQHTQQQLVTLQEQQQILQQTSSQSQPENDTTVPNSDNNNNNNNNSDNNNSSDDNANNQQEELQQHVKGQQGQTCQEELEQLELQITAVQEEQQATLESYQDITNQIATLRSQHQQAISSQAQYIDEISHLIVLIINHQQNGGGIITGLSSSTSTTASTPTPSDIASAFGAVNNNDTGSQLKDLTIINSPKIEPKNTTGNVPPSNSQLDTTKNTNNQNDVANDKEQILNTTGTNAPATTNTQTATKTTTSASSVRNTTATASGFVTQLFSNLWTGMFTTQIPSDDDDDDETLLNNDKTQFVANAEDITPDESRLEYIKRRKQQRLANVQQQQPNTNSPLNTTTQNTKLTTTATTTPTTTTSPVKKSPDTNTNRINPDDIDSYNDESSEEEEEEDNDDDDDDASTSSSTPNSSTNTGDGANSSFEATLARILDTVGPQALYSYIPPELANDLYFKHNMDKLSKGTTNHTLTPEESDRLLDLTNGVIMNALSKTFFASNVSNDLDILNLFSAGDEYVVDVTGSASNNITTTGNALNSSMVSSNNGSTAGGGGTTSPHKKDITSQQQSSSPDLARSLSQMSSNGVDSNGNEVIANNLGDSKADDTNNESGVNNSQSQLYVDTDALSYRSNSDVKLMGVPNESLLTPRRAKRPYHIEAVPIDPLLEIATDDVMSTADSIPILAETASNSHLPSSQKAIKRLQRMKQKLQDTTATAAATTTKDVKINISTSPLKSSGLHQSGNVNADGKGNNLSKSNPGVIDPHELMRQHLIDPQQLQHHIAANSLMMTATGGKGLILPYSNIFSQTKYNNNNSRLNQDKSQQDQPQSYDNDDYDDGDIVDPQYDNSIYDHDDIDIDTLMNTHQFDKLMATYDFGTPNPNNMIHSQQIGNTNYKNETTTIDIHNNNNLNLKTDNTTTSNNHNKNKNNNNNNNNTPNHKHVTMDDSQLPQFNQFTSPYHNNNIPTFSKPLFPQSQKPTTTRLDLHLSGKGPLPARKNPPPPVIQKPTNKANELIKVPESAGLGPDMTAFELLSGIDQSSIEFKLQLKMLEEQDKLKKHQTERKFIQHMGSSVITEFIDQQPTYRDEFRQNIELLRASLPPEESQRLLNDDQLQGIFEQKFRHDLDDKLSQQLRDTMFKLLSSNADDHIKEQALFILQRKIALRHDKEGLLHPYAVNDIRDYTSRYATEEVAKEMRRVAHQREMRLRLAAAVEVKHNHDSGKGLVSTMYQYGKKKLLG